MGPTCLWVISPKLIPNIRDPPSSDTCDGSNGGALTATTSDGGDARDSPSGDQNKCRMDHSNMGSKPHPLVALGEAGTVRIDGNNDGRRQPEHWMDGSNATGRVGFLGAPEAWRGART